MSYLVVCRLDQIAETAVRHRAREMISLMSPGHSFHRPGVIDPARHLTLGVNDIAAASEGLVAPAEAHVRAIIDFARSWEQTAPLVIHCWFGISRSPAAALIAALALEPDQDDQALTHRLRVASPYVTPNASLVAIADGMLGRQGRLVAAVRDMGRGDETNQGDEFRFDLTDAGPAGG